MATESLAFELFGVDVSASSTLRSVAREADRTGRALADIGTTAALGLARISAGAVEAGAALSSILIAGHGVGQVLGAMAPAALLALPAITAAAQGMAVLKLASEGVKQQFQQLAPALAELKSVAAGAIAPGIQTLIEGLKADLPVVREGVRQTAAVFGELAAQAGRVFSSGLAQMDLRTIMSANAETIGNVGQALIALGQSFVSVTAVAAPMLANLSGALVTGAENIRTWVAEARKSGELQQILVTAMSTIGDIGATVGNVIGSLVNIFGAVGSGAVAMLGPLRQITQAFQDWTSIPANLAPVVTMVEGFRSGLAGAFQQIGLALQGIGPQIAALMTNIGGALQAILPVVGRIGGELVAALLPAVSALIPPLSQFAATVGGVLASAISTLAPVISVFATGLGSVLTSLQPLLPVIGAFATAVGTQLVTVFQRAAPDRKSVV